MTTEILRPNANGVSGWDAFAYTLIDDVVEDPSSAGDGDYAMCDRSDDRVEETWGFTNVTTLTSITNCRVHLRHRGDSYTDPIDVRVKIGGVWEAAIASPNITTSYVWDSIDFAGSWVAADFDDLLLGLTTGSMSGGDEYWLGVAYITLTGTAAGGGGGDKQKMGKFMLFMDT